MKAIVVYDSRFGNTETVAKSLQSGLLQAGLQAELHFIGDDSASRLDTYDLICVGGPTEMFSASKPMKAFLERLSGIDLSGKLCFAFDTRLQSRLSGSAAKQIEKAFSQMGATMLEERESALVTTVRTGGAITGAKLKEGEVERFRELGVHLGELAHTEEHPNITLGKPLDQPAR